MTKRNNKDWAAIEKDYRNSTQSVRQIAKKYEVSESAIRKKADAGGWVRTKCAPAHPPEPEILPPPRRPPPPPVEDAAPLREAVPQDAGELAEDLVHRMLVELDATTTQIDEIEAAIYEETHDDQNDRRRSAMLKAVSLPARAMTLKTLLQARAALTESGGKKAGKKEQRQEAAATAARGKFAPPAPPKLVADHGKLIGDKG